MKKIYEEAGQEQERDLVELMKEINNTPIDLSDRVMIDLLYEQVEYLFNYDGRCCINHSWRSKLNVQISNAYEEHCDRMTLILDQEELKELKDDMKSIRLDIINVISEVARDYQVCRSYQYMWNNLMIVSSIERSLSRV